MAKDPIKKATNGTYYFRANLGKHPVTGKQIQKYRSGFATKKEARAEYSKLILSTPDELTEKKEEVTFKKFIQEIYLPWYKTQVKESTYKNRCATIEKHFSYFYKMNTDKIEPIHVQNWQLKLAKNYSPNYVRIIQGMLAIAFDRAIVLGLAKKNPARMIGNVKSRKPKIDFWTLDEFQKVISLLYKGDYYEHYLFISFWLLFMTGMRIGEAAALQWSDIDFDKKVMHIQRSMEYRYSVGEWRIGEPKSKAGYRDVPLTEEAIAILKNQKEKLKSIKVINMQFKDFVFLCRKGEPTKNSAYDTTLFKLCDKAEIDRFSMHVLRHTMATRCIEGGMRPKTLQVILGHSNVGITMNLYVHVTEDEKVKEVERIEKALKIV